VPACNENLNQHKTEGCELAEGEAVQHFVLEFRPRPAQDTLVACLWSKWTGSGEPDLPWFAAITDEPPGEVAAAGHDRCVAPTRPENIDAWFKPNPKNPAALYAIVDERERRYDEHRLAA
jgi:putative SOS response-associated peptidase YedK